MKLMSAVTTGITVLLVIVTIISTWWTILGIPVAIVLVIVRAIEKEKTQKVRYKKFILFSLTGIPSLIACFVLYFILSFLLALFGVHLKNFQLPTIQ